MIDPTVCDGTVPNPEIDIDYQCVGEYKYYMEKDNVKAESLYVQALKMGDLVCFPF